MKKFRDCASQNARFTLVNNQELYELSSDPGETSNVIADYPAEVAKPRAASDEWWRESTPLLVNRKTSPGRMLNCCGR